MAFSFKPTFGATTTTTPSFSFGGTTATPAFGVATTSTASAPGFGGFSFGGSAAPAFGTTTTTTTSGFSFGTALPSAPAFGTAASTAAAPTFGFGAPSSAAPAFGATSGTTGFGTGGGFGTGLGSTPSLFGQPSASTTTSAFGFKPATSTTFGTQCNTGGLFALQPTTQSQVNSSAALAANMCTAVSMPLIFGDERDSVIAKWNQLQAFWGTGRGHYNSQGHFVDFAPDNPFSFFKTVGYNVMPVTRNEDGFVALTIDRKMSEVCDNQQAIVDTLQRIIVTNNQANTFVCIDGIRPLLDNKTEVIIYVQQRANTGIMSRVTTSDLLTHISSATVKQSLTTQLAITAAIPRCGMTPEQVKVYMDNPPAGIDARIWEQARLDNPDPARMIPVPIVGFDELHQRLRLQEQQTTLHQARLELISSDIATLQRNQADIVAKTEQYKRNQLLLGHRILQVLVRQELYRKHGYAIQADEEQLRTKLEAIYSELTAPMQFKGRLDELMSQMRMQNQIGATLRPDVGYHIDVNVQHEIKQHLKRQQEGLSHLINIVKDDLEDVRTIEQGLVESAKLKQK